MERNIQRALGADHSSAATSGAAHTGAGRGFGVFNFGGPCPPKTPNQNRFVSKKMLYEALYRPKNTRPRTPKIKNKNIYNYILGLYGTLRSAFLRAVGPDNFGEVPPESDRWNEPSSGHGPTRPAETRRNYFEPRRHS
jgi:hypothetical protein